MENSSSMAASTDSTEALPTASAAEPAAKKKRNLPGMPDPEAEVIALSPKTLMATNRFVCEICSKGFQRDQNLQLHRRGHNLPWKLKQRTGKEIPRKRVYVCPETSCVHHSPARALGDLTGIKKHFCRKHGEKKWKCERCAKKYAVQSDWKAHMKVCGTKEYKCDCGTVFSRRDSFITHRAFCDALAEESSKPQTNLGLPLEGKSGPPNGGKRSTPNVVAPPPSPPRSPSTTPVSPVQSIQSSDNAPELLPPAARPDPPPATTETTMRGGPPPLQSTSALSSAVCPAVESNCIGESLHSPPSTEPSASLSLFLSSTTSSIFSRPEQSHRLFAPAQPQPPSMSATALLQKAAQMGATASNSSLLRGLGLAMSPSYENTTVPTADVSNTSTTATWGEREPFDPTDHGLGLGLASQESPSLMMAQSSLFGPKPMTLDFLGLGGPRTGLSALLTSLESGFGSGSPASCGGGTWDGGAV